jgi:hypothetical protein
VADFTTKVSDLIGAGKVTVDASLRTSADTAKELLAQACFDF